MKRAFVKLWCPAFCRASVTWRVAIPVVLILPSVCACGSEVGPQANTVQAHPASLEATAQETVCGDGDPIEPFDLIPLDLNGSRASVVVQNLSDVELPTGITWAVRSERNDLTGFADLGRTRGGEVAVWTADLVRLGADLREHLGGGELVLWACQPFQINGSERCRLSSDERLLNFTAVAGVVSLADGPVSTFASPAGRILAESSGLVSEEQVDGDSSDANLTVYVEKISDSADYVPLVVDGEGGAP